MNPLTQTSARSMSTGESLARKTSLKGPSPRRGSSPAMIPFLAKFEPMDGTGKVEKVAVIGSGSWGTALARLAAVNAVEKDGFDEVRGSVSFQFSGGELIVPFPSLPQTVNMWVREREVSFRSAPNSSSPLIHPPLLQIPGKDRKSVV